MDKQRFDDAIGEVPPSTVDVDAAIARGRRAAWARRVANPVTAAAAAVVVVTGGAAAIMAPGEDVRSAQPPPATTETPTPTEVPSSVSPPSTSEVAPQTPDCVRKPDVVEEPAATIQRLTGPAIDAVSSRLDGAGLVPNPMAPDQLGPLEFYHEGQGPEWTQGDCPPGTAVTPDEYFIGYANVESGDGTGNILMIVGWNLGSMACDGVTAGQTSCKEDITSDGDRVVSTVLVHEGGSTTHRVDVQRADGTAIVVEAADIGGTGKTGGAPTMDGPPLTLEQLVDIALEPAMTVYPSI